MSEGGKDIKKILAYSTYSTAFGVATYAILNFLSQWGPIEAKTPSVPPPDAATPTSLTAQTQEKTEEVRVQLPPRALYGHLAEYQLTQNDRDFLIWLAAKGFNWTDWKDREHPFLFPREIYRVARMIEEAGGIPAEVLLAVGTSETGFSVAGAWWNPRTESPVGAKGPFQIMETTFAEFAPWPGARREDQLAAGLAANNLLVIVFEGANFDTITLEEWTERFTAIDRKTGEWTGRRAWNMHKEQAEKAYELFHLIRDLRADFANAPG